MIHPFHPGTLSSLVYLSDGKLVTAGTAIFKTLIPRGTKTSE